MDTLTIARVACRRCIPTCCLARDWLREGIYRQYGAVVLGRDFYARSEDPDWFAGNYEHQVPIFVLMQEPPKTHPKETDDQTFTLVAGSIANAVRQTKAAAGRGDVNVSGAASRAQQCFKARLADELHVDVMPVFIEGGLRTFEVLGDELPVLERFQVVELPAGRTHLKIRILK